MNSKVISNIAVLVGCLAAVFSGTAAQAQNTASLAVTANIDSSATLTLSDTSGIASTLTFGGAGNETVAASEGAITVSARLSTTQGNTGTVIQIRCSDLNGQTAGNVIPASDLSYVHTTDTGGGTWFSGVLHNDWSTLADLSSGSGLYSGDQIYALTVPPGANDDTYTGTISYQVVGF